MKIEFPFEIENREQTISEVESNNWQILECIQIDLVDGRLTNCKLIVEDEPAPAEDYEAAYNIVTGVTE